MASLFLLPSCCGGLGASLPLTLLKSHVPPAALGLILLVIAREEREAAAGTGGDSPEKEERDGAVPGGGAPSGMEISSSEGKISASEEGSMMEKICPCGSDWGV